MANFSMTEMAAKMFFPDNVVQYDDAGLPSLLVYIPAFKNSDVLTGGDDSTHPAFIVNGTEIPGFYYSKYQNIVHNGKAYSLPAEDPASWTSLEKARTYCEEKGYGWHLSTAAEWAAIALWCKKNGFLPYGNNYYGRDSRENEYKSIPTIYGENGNIQRVATGTGPLTWSHDGTMSGIWDMNGNVVEWQSGLRLVWGEIQILADNNAADPDNPQNETSTCWRAINAADGSLVDPESKTTDSAVKTSGSTVKLDFVDSAWQFTTGITSAENMVRGCFFHAVSCATTIGEKTKNLLRSLALLPDEGEETSVYEDDKVFFNNTSERCPYRGGNWVNGANSGIFTLSCDNIRGGSSAGIGFRSAYIPNI